MTETKGRPASGEKLVLGFDAGCGTCADIAGRVEERIGGKLAIRNLNDPELMEWRKEALGEDARWAPTLFEVEGGEVRAWTGWRMGWALSRAIGPAATWRVMQALGEVGAAPRIEEASAVERLPEKAAEGVSGMSRGRFLKGLGGAAVAASVLSGTSLFVDKSALAATAKSPLDVIRSRKMTATELDRFARRSATSGDVNNVVRNALSTTTKIKAAKPIGYVHTLRSGGDVSAVVFNLSRGRTLAYIRSVGPLGAKGPVVVSQAKLWQADGKRDILVKGSENGRLWRRRNTRTIAQVARVQPLGECPPIGGSEGGSTFWRAVPVCVEPGSIDLCVAGVYPTYTACKPFVMSVLTAIGRRGGAVKAKTVMGQSAGCGSAFYPWTKTCCARVEWVYVFDPK